jgi:hypothetical protein
MERSEIIPWEGSGPILVFGSVSYNDEFGNFYCFKYGSQLLQAGAWLDAASEFKVRCEDEKKAEKTEEKTTPKRDPN